ncbi:MAG: tetratricopeptide repeat protein [Acidobacteria bacterium]|nr:tetratricopeptide repeat protein [Acidobacteriota bacterium]
MFKRRAVIAVAIAFFLTLGFSFLWSVEGDEREGDTATNVIAAKDAPAGATGAGMQQKKSGNRFARIFKAPFKAVGKLIGIGGDDNKLARMTEKDAAKFESVGVMRLEEKRREESRVSGTEGTARDYLDKGRALLEGGQLNEAIAELSRAASLDPKLSQAHSLLAVAYDRKGLHDRAKDSYERAIDLNERDAQTLNNLGYSLYVNGNYRAAIDRLKRAAKYAPNDQRILNNLALAQCRLGKYEDAYKSFSRAGGDFNGHTNVAALLERMGRDDEAVRHYEQARRLQPDSANVLRRLADLYARTGHPDEAEQTRHVLGAADARDAVAAGGN